MHKSALHVSLTACIGLKHVRNGDIMLFDRALFPFERALADISSPSIYPDTRDITESKRECDMNKSNEAVNERRRICAENSRRHVQKSDRLGNKVC